MKKRISQMDREIGKRIRIYRQHRGISQVALGKSIGVSFQQIQKYERGYNRVSASCLLFIASVLDYPIEQFYQVNTSQEALKKEFPKLNQMQLQWMQAMDNLPDHIQKNMIRLCQTIKESDDEKMESL